MKELRDVSHVWFKSKFNFRKHSTLLTGIFLKKLLFLSKVNTHSRNLNHHLKCREQKNYIETILVIKFWKFTMF